MVGKATNLDMVKQKQHIGGKREMGHGWSHDIQVRGANKRD